MLSCLVSEIWQRIQIWKEKKMVGLNVGEEEGWGGGRKVGGNIETKT